MEIWTRVTSWDLWFQISWGSSGRSHFNRRIFYIWHSQHTLQTCACRGRSKMGWAAAENVNWTTLPHRTSCSWWSCKL